MKRPKSFITLIWILFMLLTGCIPADTPPQLDYTPAPEFQITADDYANQAFSLSYPPHWRVISGPAEAANQVFLVSAADDALIIVNTSPLETLPDLDGVTDAQSQYVEIVDLSLHAYLIASEASMSRFQPIFAQVIATVKRR